MPPLELRPFDDGDVTAAGALLSRRHQRHRTAEPLLSPRYADPAVAAAEVAALWSSPSASGAVAASGGAVTGFLLGVRKPSAAWGPNIWVEAAGHAVAGDVEVMRDLYGYAAARWVEDGRTAHYVVVPAHDRALVDAWFHLAFGLQHVHGIREPAAVPAMPRASDAFVVRRAMLADVPQLAALDRVLPEHQARSPVFSPPADISTEEEARADWEETLRDNTFTTFVADRDGAILGAAVGCGIEKSSAHVGLSRPDNAGFLGWAVVLPEARGHGVGRALGEAVITWAASAHLPSVVTDWRATNLPSSRTWPRLGFRQTFLRLHRVVGH